MTTARRRTDVTRYASRGTYVANRPVIGDVVTVLDLIHESRGLKLIPTYSRALLAHSIHELLATDEADKKPNDHVDRIAALAFFEVARSGCVIVGEALVAGDEIVGTVLGFDETHEPNHVNIVIGVNQRRSGKQLSFKLGTKIRFQPLQQTSKFKAV